MEHQNSTHKPLQAVQNQFSYEISILGNKEIKTKLNTQNQANQVEIETETILKDAKTIQNNRWLIQWSTEEDDILFQKFIQHGSKWSELVQYLPLKTDNSIKNRFYCCMRKVQRKMNKVQKEKKIKHRKLIKYQSLLTFLEIGKSNAHFCDKRLSNANKNVEQIVEVRDMIISIAKQPQKEINDEEVQKLLLRFLDLKYSLKFINIQRVKNNSKKLVSQVQRQSTFDQSAELEDQKDEKIQENEKESEKDATNIDDRSYFDIVNLDNPIPSINNQGRKLSVLEECQDILKCSFKKQEFDYLFFL